MLERPEGSRVGCWRGQEVQTSYQSDCKVCVLTEGPLCLGMSCASGWGDWDPGTTYWLNGLSEAGYVWDLVEHVCVFPVKQVFILSRQRRKQDEVVHPTCVSVLSVSVCVPPAVCMFGVCVCVCACWEDTLCPTAAS